jgi:2-polyprenyl-3-methyl-5-hydroxy-6-metoxy-1,4-benzoquinol methylase
LPPLSTRFSDLLACPACAAPLDPTLACTGCARRHSTSSGVVDLRLQTGDAATERVRRFYAEAPFPGHPPGLDYASLAALGGRSELAQRLDQAIAPDAAVADVGCGTGQMSLFLASADRRLVAADLTRASLEVGAEAARRWGLVGRICFVETDLFAPGLRDGAFDVVYCSGVLHHTPAPARAFARIARLVRPGGLVVVGVYNRYARLLHRLRRVVARTSGMRRFPWDPVLRARQAEPARRQAWLRDQYLHPLEHRHTIGEVFGWFRDQGIEPVRTHPESLLGVDSEAPPGFDPYVDDFALEHLLVQLGWMFTLAAEGGLFIAVGRRSDAALQA